LEDCAFDGNWRTPALEQVPTTANPASVDSASRLRMAGSDTELLLKRQPAGFVFAQLCAFGEQAL